MNRYDDWQSLLRLANENLTQYGKTISVTNNDGFYAVSINEVIFAENYYEDELADTINDAWAHARIMKKMEDEAAFLRNETVSFRVVHGWTHDEPALIWSITDIELYFHDTDTDSIEKVRDSIDFYQDRNGRFMVRSEDYDKAYQQIYEHDVLGIER